MNKKLLNDPKDTVDEYLAGFVECHSGLTQLPGRKVVLRKDLHNLEGKVALLSGGGAGHEPFSAGYVGKGMLTGAISGSVFASPPPSAIFAAIKAVAKFNPSGVILIVLNYTGDRVSFGLAREWAKSEGINVEMVVNGEDCALKSVDKSAGRRGLPGTLLLFKIAGALAELGRSLEDIHKITLELTREMGTIGICLKPLMLPGAKKPSFELDDSEMELGLGIHGEAGVQRVKLRTSSDTVKMMVDHMTDKKSATHLDINAEDDVVILINNLGGTTVHEMGIVTNDTIKRIRERGATVKRVFVGAFMTSLEMAGVTISVLKINKLSVQELEVLSLLDMQTDVAVPLTTVRSKPKDKEPDFSEFANMEIFPTITKEPKISALESVVFKNCLFSSCKALIEIKEKLDEFDRGAGDGDCGATHARGAEAVLKTLGKLTDAEFTLPAKTIQKIGLTCSEMGGSSGAMHCILLSATAGKLSTYGEFNLSSMAGALAEGVNSVQEYGGATPGDRTMVDVLKPVFDALLTSKEKDLTTVCREIIEVANSSAEKTRKMKAKAGRASYVSEKQLINPDPGAVAVAQVITTCCKVILGSKLSK